MKNKEKIKFKKWFTASATDVRFCNLFNFYKGLDDHQTREVLYDQHDNFEFTWVLEHPKKDTWKSVSVFCKCRNLNDPLDYGKVILHKNIHIKDHKEIPKLVYEFKRTVNYIIRDKKIYIDAIKDPSTFNLKSCGNIETILTDEEKFIKSRLKKFDLNFDLDD